MYHSFLRIFYNKKENPNPKERKPPKRLPGSLEQAISTSYCYGRRYCHFILAWEIKSDVAVGSPIDVVQQAVDLTGMGGVRLEDRVVLLSGNGPGHLSRQFGEYLRLVGIGHIVASPYHPQTNGKIERYHRIIKGEIKLVPYQMPGELKEAMKAFIEYYNCRCYHEGLGDVTHYGVYTGRHFEVTQRRREAKNRTLQARKNYNRTAREQGSGL